MENWYSIIEGVHDNFYLVKSDYSIDSSYNSLKVLRNLCVIAERTDNKDVKVRTVFNADWDGVTDSIPLKDATKYNTNTSIRQSNMAVKNYIPIHSFESKSVEDAISTFMSLTI